MTEIVVGAAGGVHSRAALRWALARAARSGEPVSLVHAWADPVSVDAVLDPDTVAALAADLDVDSVVLPRVRVLGRQGEPAQVLLDLGHDDALLVVGGGRHHFWDRRPAVLVQLRRQGTSPVVVVPEEGPGSPPSGGPVVVGVDLSDGSAAALRWACAEAVAQDRELAVTQAWQPTAADAADVGRHAHDRHDATAALRLRRWVEDTLDTAQRPLMRLRVERGAPLDALSADAVGAELLVLGSHGHHAVSRLLAGSTSGQLALLCDGPIVVVPPLPLRLSPGA